MTDRRNRYPGAQPFLDDDFCHKVFFGREKAAQVLADKILANRMVIVYARSGLGKTSLLQAGVAPRLREEGFLPLFVRVNDVRSGPFGALLDTIPGEAKRQHIEYVPGQSSSLWSFFKTAEFWRDDFLLTPVLILDQFEELFTLQSEQAREHFLNELSYLIRGVRPPPGDQTPPDEELSEHPPAVHIVLSLREDYLGFLEEAADHIPQIMDARFRLAPLDLNAAEEAIIGPAAVTDPSLETRPFALDPTAVTAILDYLSRARIRMVGDTRRYVEPFQLQLICRRMEQIADARQKASRADLTITMADVGGEAGLTQTLRDFYREAIGSVPDRRGRRKSRRLCEKYLISSEGRRLSLEENELCQRLNMPRETLGRLVDSRLLRSDSRCESTYYELSHDALVGPILASRRIKAQVIGIGFGELLILPLLVSVIMPIVAALGPGQFDVEVAKGLFVFLLAGGLAAGVPAAILLRASARSILRYRRALWTRDGPQPVVVPGGPNVEPDDTVRGGRARLSRTIWLIAGSAGLTIVVAIVIAVRFAPTGLRPLDSILLSETEINNIMGASDMKITNGYVAGQSGIEALKTKRSLYVSQPECAGVLYPTLYQTYMNKGVEHVAWNVSQELARLSAGNPPFVEQGVAAFRPNTEEALAFVQTSTNQWKACSGQTLAVTFADGLEETWTVGDLTGGAPKIYTQKGGYACQRVLSAVSNIVIDVRACGDHITDQASRIDDKIADKAASMKWT